MSLKSIHRHNASCLKGNRSQKVLQVERHQDALKHLLNAVLALETLARLYLLLAVSKMLSVFCAGPGFLALFPELFHGLDKVQSPACHSMRQRQIQ